ncbi:vacuolar membrane-associated protein iml1 [Agyrium rufum]|nr:vacuolar membrane-associated protein iml1 [Agyrium rufum]
MDETRANANNVIAKPAFAPYHCELNIHEEISGKECVILNVSLLPKGWTVENGQRMRISYQHGWSGQSTPTRKFSHRRSSAKPMTEIRASNEASYVFTIGPASFACRDDFQVSVAPNVATALHATGRSYVCISTVDDGVWDASHIEISFRDVYLTRADMWRLVTSELANKPVYRGQKISYLGTIKAQVKSVYVPNPGAKRAQAVTSAWFGADTKPVFRSQSARYVLFIQMSKEMWDFDTDGTSEIMFHKVINGFLPELFSRWESVGARHLVSIVLFTRMEYDDVPSSGFKEAPKSEGDETAQYTVDGKKCKDFYRVLVSDMASGQWSAILTELKKEFKVFLRDVSIRPNLCGKSIPVNEKTSQAIIPDLVIAGRPVVAMRGNVLEAINLASSQFSTDYVDRDLVRTGLNIVIISPGSGVFEVDHKMLTSTTDILVANGVGIDLVCLARMPLHSVPLFKYREQVRNTTTIPIFRKSSNDAGSPIPRSPFTPTGQSVASSIVSTIHISEFEPSIHGLDGVRSDSVWRYAIPHWIDVSFWSMGGSRNPRILREEDKIVSVGQPLGRKGRRYVPRVRMYELHMMGVMENEMSDIFLQPLRQPKSSTLPLHGIKALNTSHRASLSKLNASTKPREKSEDRSLGVSPNSVLSRSLDGTSTPRTHHTLLGWMDDYDDRLFRRSIDGNNSQPSRRDEKQPAKGRLVARPKSPASAGGPFEIKPSAMSIRPTLSKGLLAKGSTQALRKSTDKPYVFAKHDKSMRKGLPRQISFGLKGFGSAALKAVPITELSSQTAHPLPNRDRPMASRSSSTSVEIPEVSTPSVGKIQAVTSFYSHRKVGSEEDLMSQHSGPINIKVSSRLRSGNEFDANATINQHRSRRNGERGTPNIQLPSDQDSSTPWLTVLNPSNARHLKVDSRSRLGRWQHLVPRGIDAANIKWKSLCSPASVPLTTDDFPEQSQLENEYEKSSYQVSIQPSEDLDFDEDQTPSTWLLNELIGSRLSQGFQIVTELPSSVGEAKASLPVFDTNKTVDHEGAFIWLSKGNSIHRLQLVNEGVIEVILYQRRRFAQESAQIEDATPKIIYRPVVRTTLSNDYLPRQIEIRSPKETYDWATLDNFIAGQEEQQKEEYRTDLQYWRARFVLIPTEPYTNTKLPHKPINEDTEEEVRLEGIRKLSALLQKHRYVPPSDRRFASNARKAKDVNPLNVIYQTRTPSAMVAAELDSALLANHDAGETWIAQLLPESEQLSRSNLNLTSFARIVQSSRGCRIRDRRWHFRLHYNCFIGSEFTTWLLANFRDIDTREEAVDFGSQLMSEGLFQHVERRHEFRDGNYFYQLAREYLVPRIDSKGRLNSRKGDVSIPSTPLVEGMRYLTSGLRSQNSSRGEEEDESSSEDSTSTATKGPKLSVLLSKRLTFDVDPRRKSYRRELIHLHYDRIASPDDCYHLRIDWMNVTPKLIEDCIVTWASVAEKSGLRLVELPIAEASRINEIHPFRAPYTIKLAVSPPEKVPQTYFDSISLTPKALPGKPYHRAILKKFNFVLDLESASAFPPSVDVEYSWGKPDYRYPQYISREGVVLAQITDAGDFLLVANRLYNNRSAADAEATMMTAQATDSARHRHSSNDQQAAKPTRSNSTSRILPSRQPRNGADSDTGGLNPTPSLSPKLRATPDVGLGSAAGYAKSPDCVTPEKIKNDLEAFCNDRQALEDFYMDVLSGNHGGGLLVSEPSTPQMRGNSNTALSALGGLILGEGVGIGDAAEMGGEGMAGTGRDVTILQLPPEKHTRRRRVS